MVAADGSVVAHPHRILCFEYTIVSIIFVAAGLSEPRDCPHIFGSPLNAYTLRKCWGYVLTIYLLLYIFIIKLDSRVWHQTLRKNLTSHANFLAYLPRGTFTTYFKLFTTFLISGLLHAIGEHVFFQNFPEGATVQFFLLQAVGITFEDAVIGIASRLGYKKSNAFKLIGFMWVVRVVHLLHADVVGSPSGALWKFISTGFQSCSIHQALSRGIFKLAT